MPVWLIETHGDSRQLRGSDSEMNIIDASILVVTHRGGEQDLEGLLQVELLCCAAVLSTKPCMVDAYSANRKL